MLEPLNFIYEFNSGYGGNWVVRLKEHSWHVAEFVMEIEAEDYTAFRNKMMKEAGTTEYFPKFLGKDYKRPTET